MKKGILLLLKAILIVSALNILVVLVIAMKSNAITRAILMPIEQRIQKKIEFRTSRIWIPTKIFLEDISIIDKGGKLYYVKTLDLRYNLLDLLFRKREFMFNVNDIKLYKNVKLFNSVADMLAISALPDVEFKEIKGALQLHKKSILIKDIYAYNNKMRIRGNGRIDSIGSLDCNISFSFSRGITDAVPDAVRTALLKYENEGWMGIDLKVKGNYRKPSLHIMGNKLKLEILEGVSISK